MIVRRATLDDVPALSVLFDEYRQFYGEPSNIQLASDFLQQRLENAETIIFVQLKNDVHTGFVVLYRGFSSVRCGTYYILDDVYVSAAYRHQGAAKQLIDTAILFTTHEHAFKLHVETSQHNAQAQQLYQSMGLSINHELRAFEQRII